MYDIFDDIFDDGYGYNDYGMSDTDVDVELAFEAAMASDTDYDFDFDYATEGLGDVMSKVGTKIADSARNMLRKIGQMFEKLAQWVKDRIAPLRAKSASGDNKALQQVLKSLDRQVTNASGPRKAEVKQKVARIKRAIMQSIDNNRRDISQINKILSDGVSIFKAAQSINKRFIEKMNAAVAYGSEKGNTDDGNDLIDKMNALTKRYATMNVSLKNIINNTDSDSALDEIITKELPGGNTRMNEILKAIKWEKVDMRAIYAAEAELRVTCTQGKEAASRLQKKLDNKYTGYKQGDSSQDRPNPNKYYRTEMDITDSEKQFDADSRQNLSALLVNWNKFVKLQEDMSKALVTVANEFTENGKNNSNSDRYNNGMRKIGTKVDDNDLPKSVYAQPTEQEIF